MIPWLHHTSDPLPPTRLALGADSQAPGLLAAGGELTPERLAEAYAHGVFPWYSAGQPVLWWSPDPRMVLRTADFRLSRSLRKTIAKFRSPPASSPSTQVSRWHRLGAVHSVETWVDGELAGGLYGIGLGRMFFGESMFAHRTDASKIALAALVCFCRENGIDTIDCQQNTGHLASMGAREMSRSAFEALIAPRLREPPVAAWNYDDSLWERLSDGLSPASFPPP